MSDGKIIAVSTFCSWASYGSMLQAYALKQMLRKLGYSSYILIDRVVVTPEMKCRIPKTLNPKVFLLGYLRYCLLNSVKIQYQKNNQFMRDNLDIIYYNGYEELALNYLKADYYLAGSDQVFNPNNPQPGFYFDYIPDKSRLLTYAGSMGRTSVAPDKEEVFRRLLNNYKRISVREPDSIPILKKYNPSAEYQVNIDPTFLLTADEWRTKEKEYPVNGKYILLYPLHWDKSLNKQLKRLKKQSGLKIVSVNSVGYSRIPCDEKLYDVGVDEFLWLVDHSEAVITSSFHGAAMATIFEKKLCIVINPDMPSRLNNLVETFGLVTCGIEDVIAQKEDYQKARIVIDEERDKSERYMKEVLHVE